MKKLLTLFFILLSINSFSQNDQDYWAAWNTNYPETALLEVLQNERSYADSVESNPDIPPYYGRVDKYRFRAEFTGQIRPLDKSIRSSMKRIYKFFIGDPSLIDKVIKSEVLIKVGGEEIWMSVQKQILKAMKDELKIGETIMLYCLYLNEHSEQFGLRNMFIISEFVK